MAKRASSIGGLIELLARSIKGKTDREIEDVLARVTERLRHAMRGSTEAQRSGPSNSAVEQPAPERSATGAARPQVGNPLA